MDLQDDYYDEDEVVGFEYLYFITVILFFLLVFAVCWFVIALKILLIYMLVQVLVAFKFEWHFDYTLP